jgi:hypothetical protein
MRSGIAMELVTALGRTIPFAFASGLNLYATIAVLGLSSRYELVALPEQFRAFDHPLVIGAALVLYLVEFVADKIPWLDTLWDTVHTVVRPIGGATVAVAALGSPSPGMDALAALLGGGVALTTHLTKAGTRAAVNTSPEPFSNWILSIGEDVLAIGMAYVAMAYPLFALTVALVLLAACALFATLVVRAVRRGFGRVRSGSRQPAAAPPGARARGAG